MIDRNRMSHRPCPGSPAGRFAISCLTIALLLSGGCSKETEAPRAATAPLDRPPVVLISIDTLRSDRLPAYGYDKVATPAIDAIRKESVLFERAYSPSPMTLPAHVSMLTGALPATHGVRNNAGYTFDASKRFFLPCHLREKGYATGAAVSAWVLRRDTGMGACFDLYDDAIRSTASRFAPQERAGAETLARATEWLARRGEAPFFFMFHIYEPHAPYAPPEPYRSLYADPYDGEIAAADAVVGKFVDELRRSGVWDRALVILVSDHGEGLGDHGEEQHAVLLNRELIQVPLMIKLPGGARGGETLAEPVQLTDLAPAIVDLLGGGGATEFDGQPLLSGALAPDRPIFAETLYPRIHLGWSDLASLVRGRHHYIEGPRPELYDVVADPGEVRNLASEERRLLAEMKEAIRPFVVPMEAPAAVDAETMKKMAALGYIGSPASRSGPLPDPKENIADLEAIRGALLAVQDGRVREAETRLRALLSRNPKMTEGWARLGDVLGVAGDYAGAADAYREAVRSSPIAAADLLLDAGDAALLAERFEDAASLARAATSGSPNRAYALLARAELATGRLVEAEQAARRAFHAPPQADDLVLLASVFHRQGRLEEALATLADAERAAAVSGPVYGLAALRADTLAMTGNFDGALAAYQAEVASFPANLQAWSAIAALRFMGGDAAGADRALEDMVARNPGPAAKLIAARTLEALEDPAGAARWRERAARER
jgi:choline-sulfatase